MTGSRDIRDLRADKTKSSNKRRTFLYLPPERSASFRAFTDPYQRVSRIQKNKPLIGVAEAAAIRQIEDKRPVLLAEKGFPRGSFLK
jgi:hypothetical protein